VEQIIFLTVLNRIEEQRQGIRHYLAGGGVETQLEYWKLVGKYEALGNTVEEIKEVEQRYIDP
jgi:hypothetical protein